MDVQPEYKVVSGYDPPFGCWLVRYKYTTLKSYSSRFFIKFLYVLDASEYKFLKSLGSRVSFYRQRADISQSQLAFEISTSLRQIQRIEAGTANASIIYYYRIAEALGVNFEDLLRADRK